MKEIYEFMQKLLKCKEKVAPEMNKSIKSRPRDGKTRIFRSDAHAKILRFFNKMFIFRSDVHVKI